MSKKLKLDMIMNNGSTKTYSINEPKSNLTLANCRAIAAAMCDSISNPLQIGEIKPTGLKSASYEETIVTDIVE